MNDLDLLATPWRDAYVPVPSFPALDGPPELARVDVTPRPEVPAQRAAEDPVRA